MNKIVLIAILVMLVLIFVILIGRLVIAPWYFERQVDKGFDRFKERKSRKPTLMKLETALSELG